VKSSVLRRHPPVAASVTTVGQPVLRSQRELRPRGPSSDGRRLKGDRCVRTLRLDPLHVELTIPRHPCPSPASSMLRLGSSHGCSYSKLIDPPQCRHGILRFAEDERERADGPTFGYQDHHPMETGQTESVLAFNEEAHAVFPTNVASSERRPNVQPLCVHKHLASNVSKSPIRCIHARPPIGYVNRPCGYVNVSGPIGIRGRSRPWLGTATLRSRRTRRLRPRFVR